MRWMAVWPRDVPSCLQGVSDWGRPERGCAQGLGHAFGDDGQEPLALVRAGRARIPDHAVEGARADLPPAINGRIDALDRGRPRDELAPALGQDIRVYVGR